MKRKFTKSTFLLLGVFILLFSAVIVSTKTAKQIPKADYDRKLQAALQMDKSMAAVKGYKKERGIPLHPADWHRTGMLGEDFNLITTTLGSLAAKRTTANGDMAAMVVEMLGEADLKPGDRIGVSFSGSFPALNIAVLSACQEYELQVVTIPSVGSSTYGGNNPEFSSPEMVLRLMEEGYFPPSIELVTLGGAGDVGEDMDPVLRDAIHQRILSYGVPVMEEKDYAKNLEKRQAIYGDIDCFIGVGGNVATLGRDSELLQSGLISPTDTMPSLTEKSGLLEVYHNQGLPVILLLNVQQLTTQYGLEFDPEILPYPGTSAIYYDTRYSISLLVAALGGSLILLFFYKKTAKQHPKTRLRKSGLP